MSAVKDQGTCNSSFAHAAASVLEGALARKKDQKAPKKISVQEMVDCQTGSDANVAMFGKNYDNDGCKGGLETNAWDFVKDWGALSEKEYSYEMMNWDEN